MYNWDDPINDALSKPDIVPEKKVHTQSVETSIDKTTSQVENFPKSADSGVGSTGMEDIEHGAKRIQVDDKAIINCRADLNQLVPFKYKWAWQKYLDGSANHWMPEEIPMHDDIKLWNDPEGLRPEEVKRYMRYMADIRLNQLKLQPIYKINTNPLPWMDEMLNAVEHTNFFENRATEYSKAATTGTWEEAFA